MTNNSVKDIKLVPYKEVARKKALDYYYANREVIMEKSRNRYRALSAEEKRRDMSLINNGITDNHLKKAEIKQKQKEYSKNRHNNLMVEVK